jgi:uncharacterized membrane protein
MPIGRRQIAARVLAGALVAAGLLGPGLPVAAAPRPAYTVTDLGTLGGAGSAPDGINERGQVVGVATGGPYDPLGQVVWWDGGAAAPLAPQPDPASIQTLAITDAGRVVGAEVTINTVTAGIDRATPTAAPRLLPYLALGVNRAGQVVGVAGPELENTGGGFPVLV